MNIVEKIRELCIDTDFSMENVSFKSIRNDNDIWLAMNFKLGDNQVDFVTENIISIAQAYVNPTKNLPYLIYVDNNPVGFIMLRNDLWLNQDHNYTWRIMIDKNHQGKGYGKVACKIAINIFEKIGAKFINISVDENNQRSIKLYESLGFSYAGKYDGDEKVYQYKL